MSIVLEALEKAQRKLEKASTIQIDKVLQTDERHGKEIRILPRRRAKRKFFIFALILFIGALNLVFIGWRLNRINSSIPIDIPTVPKIPLPKIIPAKDTHSINVTGVVWDEKEPVALVNGKFLKEGDEILGAKIIDIQMHEVRFLYKDKEFAIPIE